MPEESLEQLRAELSRLDRKLLEIVSSRMRISLDIGRTKKRLGRGTRDFVREKVVLERARKDAERLQVSPDLAEQLMLLLIQSSLSVQEQDRVSMDQGGVGKRALVIGGSGKMGRWFVSFLDAQGYHVEIADPGQSIPHVPHHLRWQDAPDDFDLIVLAAPLLATNAILHEMAESPPSGVVFDVGSLKSPLRDGLTALREAGGRVTSVHPMFGPTTSVLTGRHVIFVDVGCVEANDVARRLFSATTAEQAEMSLDDHDRLIAFVLGLSHALNLAFNAALTASGAALPLLSRISSTTFDSQVEVATRVSSENPRLYFEIQALNDFGHTSLDALAEAVDALRAMVREKDEDRFVEMMETGRAYLMGRTPTGVQAS